MKISILQYAPVWGDADANLKRLSGMLRSIGNTDLVVLPEMFTTGFVTEPEGIVTSGGGEVEGWMRDMAGELGCAIAGSAAVCEGGEYRNRFFFVFPDGRVETYDKRHLFTFGGEGRTFAPGEKRVVVEYMGVRILLQICYDLRFPVFSRNVIKGGVPEYDMVLYVACWPEVRIEAWKALLRARAIENQCYVAGVNRVGLEPVSSPKVSGEAMRIPGPGHAAGGGDKVDSGLYYCGGSMIISPQGSIMASCRDGEEGAAFAEIDISALAGDRRAFPVLHDADRFRII